jgi:hypothetical protein
MWCGAVCAASGHISTVRYELLDHGDVPSTRGHMQRRLARIAPGKVRIRTTLEQPEGTSRIIGPLHHVHERWNAMGNAVDIDVVTAQQLEWLEGADACCDVRRNAVGGVRSSFEERLCQR